MTPATTASAVATRTRRMLVVRRTFYLDPFSKTGAWRSCWSRNAPSADPARQSRSFTTAVERPMCERKQFGNRVKAKFSSDQVSWDSTGLRHSVEVAPASPLGGCGHALPGPTYFETLPRIVPSTRTAARSRMENAARRSPTYLLDAFSHGEGAV